MRQLLSFIALLALAAPAVAPAADQPTLPKRVRLETTAGVIVLDLDAARAPLTVANFVQYVREGHYDGTIFHRVIANFVVQGGGYAVDGTEKPCRTAVPNESGNGLSNRRGTIAMARVDDPHSGTAQFYLNIADNLALDPSPSRWGYAVFGRVVEGMDVVDRIANVATGARGPFKDEAPLEPVIITKAQVVEPAP
jgi:cyclophilin family peptidyl-prolyl cis-trans isomerase